MNRKIRASAVVLALMLPFPPSPGKADPGQPKIDLPYGILIRGSSCAAATHTILNPCYPYPPIAFAVFPKGKNVTRYEGQNVTMHATVDQTSCPLPLLEATKVSLSSVLPPCLP